MKAVLTLIALVFFATTAVAQDPSKEVKVEVTVQPIEMQVEIETQNQSNEVARLYMFKNSRVKKALAFKTKRNKSKLA
ncbi:hypothetical protein ABV409_11610 [Flagellimonas sp. DF-77]|uniref:hypothetical protein n=1 Tax=Flagellimonas algarum TaxID=3230298 RepID=UPI00339492F4